MPEGDITQLYQLINQSWMHKNKNLHSWLY